MKAIIPGIILIVICFYSGRLNAQSGEMPKGFNSASYEEILENGSTLTETERKALFNKEFTMALSDVPTNYIGNYASINIGETKASFAASFVGDGSVFGLNLSGGTSDGTLKFINNNELNYNLNLGVQYHFIDASKKIHFTLDQEDWDSKRMQKRKLLTDASLKEESIRKGENLKSFLTKKNTLNSQISEIDKNLKYIKVTSLQLGDGKPKSLEAEAMVEELQLIKQQLMDLEQYQKFIKKEDSTYYFRRLKAIQQLEDCFSKECIKKRLALQNDKEIKATYLSKKNLEDKLSELEDKLEKFKIEEQEKKLYAKKKELSDELKEVEGEITYLKENKELLISLEGTKLQKALVKHDREAVQTYGSKFNWFSVGTKIGLKSFVLYEGETSQEQVNVKESANLELNLQYSWHSQNQLKQWKSYLINTGMTINYGDNFSALKSMTLEDLSIVSTTGQTTRTTSNETLVYTGDYRDDIAGVTLYTDMYYFLFSGNYAALHIYPTANFSQFQKPLFNAEFGLLLAYKSQEKKGSVVNVELFYSLRDLGNRGNSDLGLFARNTIGLRLTVPIKFKYEPQN
ncbi:hypothetical protein AB9K32_07750 [Allomuricauda sp. XS_ASV26]|uniref:hypothetical protein n=1 Tax=Allomuricauda sp. XS_ASV26 TaxID=3241292 RepID=UPI0035145B16